MHAALVEVVTSTKEYDSRYVLQEVSAMTIVPRLMLIISSRLGSNLANCAQTIDPL